MTPDTRRQLNRMLAVAEAIKSLGSVPSGHLYAQLMDRMELDEYNQIIAALEHVGIIKVTNHLITYQLQS